MNTEAQCICTSCSQPIVFAAERAGEIIECPACKRETPLFLPPIVPAVVPEAKPEKPFANYRPETRIEDRLDEIGGVFFFIGIAGAAACLLGVLVSASTTGLVEGSYIALASMVLLIFQGFMLRTLFRALAEIIRLLRKISRANP